MTKSFEEYETEYNDNISHVRRILADNRTPTSLEEAERYISDAKNCAHAMQALSEVAGDVLKIQDTKRRISQEIAPLSKEITTSMNQVKSASARNALFQTTAGNFSPTQHNAPANTYNNDTNQLLHETERLLMESQALCIDSEVTGSRTIEQMGIQREQLQISLDHIHDTASLSKKAGIILKDMRARALRSKIFLYCVIALLILANMAALHRLMKK